MDSLKEELNALKGLVKKKEKKPEQKEEKKPEKKTSAEKIEEQKSFDSKSIELQESKSPELQPLKENPEKIQKQNNFLDSKKFKQSSKFSEAESNSNPVLDFYYFFEDKYYAFLDKVNNFFPVYKVVDPIDRILPSFLLFLGLILLILVLLFSVFVVPFQAKAKLTVQVIKKDSGNPLSDFNVVVFVDGEKSVFITDENGRIVLTELDLNSGIKIQVKGVENYKDFEQIVLVEEEESFFTVELERKTEIDSGWNSKTVYFKDEYGDLVKSMLRISFECSGSNSGLKIKNESGLTARTSKGSLLIEFNDSCGDIFVSVESSNYEKIEGELLSGSSVYLSAKASPEGTIHIKVKYNGSLIDRKMKFALFNQNETEPIDGFSESSIYSGSKSFEFSPGTYFIKVFDANTSNPEYECPDSSSKELTEGNEIEFVVECFLAVPDDSISVNVFDKNSGNAVDSVIELRKKTDSGFEFVRVSRNVSSVNFSVSDENKYIVLVSSRNYLPYEGTDLLSKGDSLEVELIKASNQNSGKALISVLDADNNPSSGAKIYLRYSDGKLMDLRTPYSVSSGFNGEALIEGIKPGNYYAEAFTNTQKGFSAPAEIDANSVSNFTVSMEKSRGFVELKAFDLDSGDELENFTVEFFDSFSLRKLNESVFVFNPSTGIYAFDAGEYFAVVLKNGFYSTQTAVFSVSKNAKTYVNVMLREKEQDDNPVLIDFIGLKKNGQPVNSLDLGEEYSAEFNLTLKNDSDMFFFNFLIGTGKENLMQDDSLFISSVLTPFDDAVEVLKSTSFTGNFSVDFNENSTSGNAKAVLVSFNEFDKAELDAESFIVSAKIKLKDKILDADNLSLFYKALAVSDPEEPFYFLDPEDERDFSSLQARTYSNAKTQGINLCEENFCYSFLVESVSSDDSCKVIRHGSVSSLKINCPYNLISFLLNNKKDYDSVNFFVQNSSLEIPSVLLNAVEFNDYLIETKQNNFSDTANSSVIEVSLPFNLNHLIYSDANFIPVNLIKSDSKIPAIESGISKTGKIDSNFLELQIRSDLNLNVFVSPAEVPAFTQTDLTVEVLDEQGNSIEFASVKLKIQDSVSGQTLNLGPLDTDSFGKAVFIGSNAVPELNPNSRIEIIVEAEDLEPKSKIIFVGKPITFDFSPKTFLMVFSPLDNSIHSVDLNFFSLLDEDSDVRQEITGYSIEFESNSDFFVEKSLYGYQREFVPEGILTEFKLSLDTSKTENLTSTLAVDANLNLTIRTGNYFFIESIPFKVLINPLSDYVKAQFKGKDVNSDNPVVVSLFSDSISSVGEFDLVRKNSLAEQIKINEIQLVLSSAFVDFPQTEFSLNSHQERFISSVPLTVDFTVFLNDLAEFVDEKTIENAGIFFEFNADNKKDFLMVPLTIEIIPENDALKTFPKNLNYSFYLREDSPETIFRTVNFKSESSDFPITITSVGFELDSELVSQGEIQGMDTPSLIRNEGRDANFFLSLTEAGKALQTSRVIDANLSVYYEVKGKELNEKIPVNISILTVPEDIESQTFDLKACIGEGSLQDSKENFEVDFWIGCNLSELSNSDLRECYSGAEEKPKILLDWKFNSFSVNSFDSEGSCTKSSAEDNSYVYCDGAQFSMELINRIIEFKKENSEGNFSFKAVLISDNFSFDFFDDFDEWAVNNVLTAGTPASYNQTEEEADYGIVRKYFHQNRIDVFVNGVPQTEINSPGWYDVSVNAGEKLELHFNLIQSSSQLEREKDYVFYYIPFDGEIGLNNSVFNRPDYGSSFDVVSSSGNFKVNESGFSIFSSQEISGFSSLWFRQINDFSLINSIEPKGTLLKLTKNAEDKTIDFYQGFATPLALKAVLSQTADPALIYYSVLNQNQQALNLQSDNLIEWQGLGNQCIDFSGNEMQNKLYSDLKADSSDQPNVDSDTSFKLMWPSALHTGSNFYFGLAFTPVNSDSYYLNIVNYSGNPFELIKLYSRNSDDESNPSAEKNFIELNGLEGVNFNHAPNSYSDSMQDLFNLIEQDYACITNQANTTYVLWNKEKFLNEMNSRINSLNPENLCIIE